MVHQLIRFGCLIWLLLAVQGINAQQNPFDLVPRLDPSIQEAIEEVAPHPTGNVFDVVPPPQKYLQQRPFLLVEPREEKPGLPNYYRRFVFSTTMFSLILLTFLISLFRTLFVRIYLAFRNENILNQIYRDRDSVGILSYYILYLMFFINAGFFIFLLGHLYERMPFSGPHLLQLLKCIGLVMALVLSKHLILNILAYVFPVEKEVGAYNFTIMVFSIVLGVILIPANLLIAYSSPETVRSLALIIFFVLGGIYLYRYLRGLMIANKYLAFHKFHFLLYICTVEVAPVMVLLKLLNG